MRTLRNDPCRSSSSPSSLRVLRSIHLHPSIADASSVWSVASAATTQRTGATTSGISLLSGMTSVASGRGAESQALLAEAVHRSLLSVSPVEDMKQLSHRAGSSDVLNARSEKVMQFGKGGGDGGSSDGDSGSDGPIRQRGSNRRAGKKKKKAHVKPGSPQEEASLLEMVHRLTELDEARGESHDERRLGRYVAVVERSCADDPAVRSRPITRHPDEALNLVNACITVGNVDAARTTAVGTSRDEPVIASSPHRPQPHPRRELMPRS